MTRSLLFGSCLLAATGAYAQSPLPLSPGETAKTVYLIIEEDEFVAADAGASVFVELRRQAKEELIEKAVAEQVIVLATNQRFVAYSTLTKSWHELKRRANEQLVVIQAEDFSALVTTTDRYLTFNGQTGVWGQRKH